MKKLLRNIIIAILIFLGSTLIILSNQIGGFRLFIVSSASMEPALPTGALILTKYINPNALQVGDVITFLPPQQNSEFVTHRITKADHKTNPLTFRTKGDSNNNEDPWILAGGAVVGEVIYTFPYLGYIFSFIQSPTGIIFFILLPAVYIIIDELLTIKQTITEYRKKKTVVKETTNH